MKRVVKKSTSQLDKLGNQPIVKSSEQETPPDGASNTIQGLTDHAGIGSMAAESNTILTLSSRQLLSPAVDGFFVAQPLVARNNDDHKEADNVSGNRPSSQLVVYVPPESRTVHAFALAVCNQMKTEQTTRTSATEVMQGLSHFLNCVAIAQANHLNRGGADADEEIDLLAA